MKQILQNIRNGLTEIVEVPIPSISENSILVRSSLSLVSAGTEKMLVDFGKSNYLSKALKQPERIQTVLDKVKTDGLQPAINSIMNKLDQPLPMGYSNVGIVIETGKNVTHIKVGDRVLSNGYHAEIVKVPKNMCVKIPVGVSDEEAVFGVIGSVALQSVRLSNPTLGEYAVVFGLGLVGLITVQILKANGCNVLGIDYDSKNLKLAEKMGIETVNLSNNEDIISRANYFSNLKGVDIVIISATSKSNKIIEQAAKISRKRGRIILSGVVGLNFSRQYFYEKELTFQVSCSYGPGRYDYEYETLGFDYPYSFVRWTAQRNFEAVLSLLSKKLLKVKPLISHTYKIKEANQAYKKLLSPEKTLGIIIKYPSKETTVLNKKIFLLNNNHRDTSKTVKKLAFIGAGNYVGNVLASAFAKQPIILKTISSQSGLSCLHIAKKYSFEQITTDVESIFLDKDIDAVVIATQHNTHADYIVKALKAQKHVFVEKPLCISYEELKNIKKVYYSNVDSRNIKPIMMVGFNRRFSPLVLKAKDYIDTKKEPKSIIITVNAGSIPSKHWTQNTSISGGRIIGEGCHFIDLSRFLIGSSIINHSIISMKSDTNDTVSIALTFEDGSIASINYFSNGSKSVIKERLEIYVSNSVVQIENFKSLKIYSNSLTKKKNLWVQDKGQNACASAFIRSMNKNLISPIPINEIFEVADVTLNLAQKLREK